MWKICIKKYVRIDNIYLSEQQNEDQLDKLDEDVNAQAKTSRHENV